MSSPHSFADDDRGWREARTAHCVFIFRQKDEPAVRELVGFAEEVYADVTGFFDTYPREVRSIVLGDIDEANGSYNAPPHHLTLIVRAPLSPWLGSRGPGWLRLLFTHELVHYCDFDADVGFFFVLSLLFGEGVKSGGSVFLPPWTYEGAAVLLETELTSGGRGRNPFFLMHAAAMLADDVPFTLGHLEYYSAYPPPARYYLFGYLLLDYMKHTFGTDVYKNIRRRFLDFPLAGPWEAIRAVTGRHQDELWLDMRAYWKERLRSNPDVGEGTAVTPAGFGDYYRPIETSAGLYLYRTRLDRPPAVVSYDRRTGKELILFEEALADERSLTATADGKMVVYAVMEASGNGLSRFRLVSDLYAAEISVTDEQRPFCRRRRRLTQDRHLWHPALSPDGALLAAVQGAGAYSRLVLIDQASGRVSVLFAEECASVYNPVFSPDGKSIAFAVNRRGVQDIVLIDAAAPSVPEDGDPALLVNVNRERAHPLVGYDEAGDYFPRFLDNDVILFTSDREGYLAIYAAHREGKTIFRMCSDRIAAFDGISTAEGILYTTYRASGTCLKSVTVDPEGQTCAAVSGDEPLPPPPARPAVTSTPFYDLPLFQFWLPYGNILIVQERPNIAFGIYLLFDSYLGTNHFDIALLYYSSFNQPDVKINVDVEIGPLNLYYSLSHTFAEYGTDAQIFYRERCRHILSAELPLIDRRTASEQEYASVSFSITHDFIIDGYTPFPFLNGFDPGALPNGNFLSAEAGFFLFRGTGAAPAAFYPPGTVVNAFSIAVPLPVLDETRTGCVILNRFYCTLPGFWNLSTIRLGVKADFQTDELRGPPWVTPRGFAAALTQAERGRGILLLDYLATIAFTDAPLPGGWHCDGLGGGVHVEIPFDWDIISPAFACDRYFYLGIEFTIAAGLGTLSVPIGIGVTMRLDRGFSKTPDMSDFAFYFFFSFNSYWSGAGEAPPLNRRFR